MSLLLYHSHMKNNVIFAMTSQTVQILYTVFLLLNHKMLMSKCLGHKTFCDVILVKLGQKRSLANSNFQDLFAMELDSKSS